MTMTSRQLPPNPHPIASAFFDAFDAHQDDVELETSSKSDNTTTNNNNNSSSSSSSSNAVTKIRNSLGWRTRYSSSALYPVSVLPVKGRRRKSSDGVEKEVESYHVRQVFPRQSEKKRADDGHDIQQQQQQQQQHDADEDGKISPISLNEDDCEFGTGATVWPGSIVLLKYLERLAHDPSQRYNNVLKGKTVADLGSGTAITTIASALLGADVVVCTDGCDPVVDLARRNINDAISHLGSGTAGSEGELIPTHVDNANNKLAEKPIHSYCEFRGCRMIARKYRWGEGMSIEDIRLDTSDEDNSIASIVRKTKHFDIILGADCIVPKLYPIEPLVDAIDELSGDETISYLSYEQRHYENYDPAVEFLRLAATRDLEVEVVPDRELHHLYPANDIEIWKVTRSDRRRRCGTTDGNRVNRGMQTAVCLNGRSGRSNHRSLLVGSHS